MSSDVEILRHRANQGDAEAQRDLAICLHNGEGVGRDQSAAALWFKKAAEGGDAWAQTQYAIQLRSSGLPENERGSVEWLKRAAAQADPRGRLTLAIQQYLGIGTPVDLESALVNMTMAALSGFEDAKAALAEMADLSDAIWNPVFDRVQWAQLTFLMGPLLDGHLEGLTTYQQHKDGGDDTVWMRYETETAEMIFDRAAAESILDTAFGCTVSVTDHYVGRAIIEDHTLAAVTISLRHIVNSRGRPVCFKPSEPALDLITSLIGMMAARKWVRWSYTSF